MSLTPSNDEMLRQYQQNLNAGVRSSASEFARRREEEKYYERMESTRFLTNATSATNALSAVVSQAQAATTERDQLRILVAKLLADVYGIQSYLTCLAAVTGSPYTPSMYDPQISPATLLEQGSSACASLHNSVQYIRDHIMATRLVLDVNKRARIHVEHLASALAVPESLESIVRESLTNTYRADTSSALDEYTASVEYQL